MAMPAWVLLKRDHFVSHERIDVRFELGQFLWQVEIHLVVLFDCDQQQN
jgi:hypothetical protein